MLLGKLATHEMAHAGPSFDLPWPPARNPWNLAHFTGGSSTGSGAAVAAGLVPVALGSDTGGSIRGPASHCGVVGLMPTFGLVSRAGVITNSYTFDHCGPLARTVEDCALVLQALAGYDARDAGSVRRPIPAYREALGARLARSAHRRPAPPLGGGHPGVGGHAAGHGRSTRRAAAAGRRAGGVSRAAARAVLRLQDHHRGERDLQRPPEEPDRAGQGLRRGLPLAGAALRALHRERLRPGHARASPDDGRDGAALRALRRLRHRRHGRGAAADGLSQRLVLAEAQPAHGVERHRPAGTRAAQRLRARTDCRSACRSSAGRSRRPPS